MSAVVEMSRSKSVLVRMAERYGVEPDKMLTTLKATAFKGEVSNEQMMALMVVAEQYGLNPWTKEIYAFPSKGGIVPMVSIDGWLRIINSRPELKSIEFEYDASDEWIACIIARNDREKPVVIREYMKECKRETDPWRTHPRRMLRHKAMIQCARIAFGYGGIYDQDEAERILDNERRDAGRIDPRGEALSDTSLRDKHYGAVVDLMSQDKEEWQIAQDLNAYVTEHLNVFPELYIAVLDRLASEKVITKAKFRQWLQMQPPQEPSRATVLIEREPGSDDE